MHESFLKTIKFYTNAQWRWMDELGRNCKHWKRLLILTEDGIEVSSSDKMFVEGNGNPLQCSCLENPRDGGAWWAAVYGVAQSRTRLKQLSSSSSSRSSWRQRVIVKLSMLKKLRPFARTKQTKPESRPWLREWMQEFLHWRGSALCSYLTAVC